MCIYIFIYNWFTLLNSRNGHNIVKQLYSSKKCLEMLPKFIIHYLSVSVPNLSITGQVYDFTSDSLSLAEPYLDRVIG